MKFIDESGAVIECCKYEASVRGLRLAEEPKKEEPVSSFKKKASKKKTSVKVTKDAPESESE